MNDITRPRLTYIIQIVLGHNRLGIEANTLTLDHSSPVVEMEVSDYHSLMTWTVKNHPVNSPCCESTLTKQPSYYHLAPHVNMPTGR